MPETQDDQDILARILKESLNQTSLIAVLKLLVLLLASVALGVGSLMAALGGAGVFAWTGVALFAGFTVVALRGLLLAVGMATRRPGDAGRSPWTVSVAGDQIACRHARRAVERISWGALVRVGLRADDLIPVGDVYWLLFDEMGGVCVAPIGAAGSDALLSEMRKRLPGFDNEAVVEIIGALEGGTVVWERPAVSA